MIKVFEMFAGDGGGSFALKKAKIPFECVGYSEIDKFAIECYNQNHPFHHIKNYGDATKIDPGLIPDFDLLIGGFPCQSFSNAGKGLGEKDTRGTLFYEIIRIAEVKKPKYMLLENVKGLTTKRHKKTFDKILSELKRIGYNVLWKVLNSKNYGIPQNRERIWFVCFRDYVESLKFKWPDQEELKIFLADILEDHVDEKYNLSENHLKRLLISTDLQKSFSKIDPKRGVITRDLKIRKLTPTECFRLMGFLDDEINLDGLSNTQKYKLAGNGWDINLVSKIFKQMFKNFS